MGAWRERGGRLTGPAASDDEPGPAGRPRPRGEASGRPGLPLEAQDGGVGRCGQVWSGVLHLGSVWLPPL